jgi:NAD(P)-dependent dehydrogenase (short-subunit alcohol dehydrogenase family)
MSTILVTGATTGLGLALSRLLLEHTASVLVLTARASSLPRLEVEGLMAGERILPMALDVTDGDQRLAVVEQVTRSHGGIDVLINNAGVAYRSVVEHVTEEERIEQMGVNFRGPMELARLVLPYMRQQRSGRIINVSSVGGMMAMPTMAVYSASKFALEGATESLYYEVKPWGIKVSLIEPGFIHSSSFQKVHYTSLGAHAERDPEDPYYMHYHHMTPFIERMMDLTLATPDAACGLWLVFWGSFILLGWHLKWSAIALGAFVVAVTALVHAPALISYPPTLPQSCLWMWDILQRSNFVKNLCLLGVCFHLLHHEPGKLSLAAYLQRP